MSDVRKEPVAVEIFDLDEFSVEAFRRALEVYTGKASFITHEELMKLIKEDLTRKKREEKKETPVKA